MTYLSWLLMCFEAFELKDKLNLVGRLENMEYLAFELGCKVGHFSSTCLGLMVGASYKLVTT